MIADGVFEGGGVKGIGLVGALCYFEEQGCTWKRLAGTSAGAIIAALLSVGYTGKELKEIMSELNYKMFLEKTKLQALPVVGKPLGFFIEKGIYSGDIVESWIEELLLKKGKTKFKDVYLNGQCRLKIIATDITKRDMLILPDDLKKYNIDPKEFPISKAVRMSIAIPFYFKPVKLVSSKVDNYIVDGGVLSNFPVWIFDIEGVPRWPTFGFKMVEGSKGYTASGKKDIVSYALDLISTMIEKDESRFIRDKDLVRTIKVPNTGVIATDFNITREKCNQLFNSGYKSAARFMRGWSYEEYVRAYRMYKKEV